MPQCSISPNIREGLLETFYGVYEKDADKVIMSLFYLINDIMVLIVSLYLLPNGNFYPSAGPTSNDSNGCSCAYWRYDSCQKNSSILPKQVLSLEIENFYVFSLLLVSTFQLLVWTTISLKRSFYVNDNIQDIVDIIVQRILLDLD